MSDNRHEQTAEPGKVDPPASFARDGTGAKLLSDGLRSGAFAAETQTNHGLEFLHDFHLNYPTQPGSIRETAGPQERRDFLSKPENIGSADVASLWNPDSRVLQIGDNHHKFDSVKDWTAANMAAFKQQGAAAFGMEFLPQGMQKDLDDYAKLRKTGTPQEIQAARAPLYERMAAEQREPWEAAGNPEAEDVLRKQFALVDKAIDNGLRPLAIEPEIGGMVGSDKMHSGLSALPQTAQGAFDKFVSPIGNATERATARGELEKSLPTDWSAEKKQDWLKTIEKARSAGLGFSQLKLPRPAEGEVDSDWDSRVQNLRNDAWSKVAANYLNDQPDAKLVMFAGASHFKYGPSETPLGTLPSITERLGDAGVKSTVLQFAGGDYKPETGPEETARRIVYWTNHPKDGIDTSQRPVPDTPESAHFAATKWTQTIATDSRLRNKSFALKIASDEPAQGDYVVHLSQK